MTVAEAYLDAVTKADVDGMQACFTDDATYHDLLLGSFTGREALQGFFERMLEEAEELVWTVDRIATGPDLEMVEWSFTYTVGENVPQSAGRRFGMSGTSVFELTGGRCSTYREYFDRGKVLVALGLEPASLHKVLSR